MHIVVLRYVMSTWKRK